MLKGPKDSRPSIDMNDDSELKKKFLSLKTYKDLAQLLGLSEEALRYFRHTQPYSVFPLQKKSGGFRTISAPTGPLKTIQRRLASVLNEVYGYRSPVHGFVPDRSIVSNAKIHVGRTWVFNFDLANFFPTIHLGRVRGLFFNKPFSLPYEIANAIAEISCYLGTLPQGAPTSPILSNLICGALDTKLKLLARLHHCQYTRYADDITFSCDSKMFPSAIAVVDVGKWKVSPELEAVIKGQGFEINEVKTSMRTTGARQVVTGIIVNKKINLSKSYLNAVRGMVHCIKTRGVGEAQQIFHDKFETKQSVKKKKILTEVVAGKVNHIGFVKGWDSTAYLSLASALRKEGVFVRKSSVSITGAASRKVLDQGVWLVDAGVSKEYAVQQSSGFSWGKYGIVTAAHAVGEYLKSGKWQQYEYVQVRRPHLGEGTVYKAKVIAVHSHADLALIEYPFSPLVSFRSGPGENIVQRDTVRILGFPHYHDGDSCTDQDFVVNATRIYSGIHHRVVVGSIVTGNSGGPVLNQKNEVVGIALKGQEIPAHFSDKDSLSSFTIAESLKLLLDGKMA